MSKPKKLKKGYTTGSCSAAAAAAAVRILLFSERSDPKSVRITLPGGEELDIPIHHIERGDNWVKCAVKKDSGDDPDVTHGTLVYGKVSHLEGQPGQVVIQGGEGIGTVTKPGLACPVGGAAINPVPRQMIRQQVGREADAAGYGGGLLVEISIPAGVELAKKTFNSKLGIVGGLSVLGTTGIVEPMSEQALIDTIKVEINMKKAIGMKNLILTPGNYGQAFLQERLANLEEHVVKCSNFIGDSLSHCKELDFDGVILAGHIGKLVKVAAGAMNTHSKYGDARMETLAVYAEGHGAEKQTIQQILECVTTEEALSILKQFKLEEPVVQTLLYDVVKRMKEQTQGLLQAEAILYSNQHGYLGQTEGVEGLIEKMMGEKEWENYTE